MKRILTAVLALLLLFAAGCSNREETEETPSPAPTVTPTPAPTPTPTPTPTATPAPTSTPEPEGGYRNPFNGAAISEPWSLRPFTVMINNHTEALPQCGVGGADIIYEVLVEGGITRMMAVFSDIREADTLMAVRSIRPYYLDIALSYGAVICHAGGSDEAYSRISNEKLNNIDGVRGSGYGLTVFDRDRARVSAGIGLEHTMYTDGEKLYEAAINKGYTLEVDPDGYDAGLRFSDGDGVPKGGESAERIVVSFGYKTTDLLYDSESGMYTASQYNARYEYVDGNTGEPVEFRNVIGIFAPARTLDGYGRLAIDTTVGGAGYYCCGGKYVPITWKRSAGESFRYYLENGKELEISEGRTYIAIMPTEGGMTFDA